MQDCLAVILGGGRGTRLFPLTRERSKPAVPIAGKYRLIDIPLSNCINSELRRIFVLTQYNSESLNNHVGQTYKFDAFSRGFVTVLAAEQTDEGGEWFQGTADAVRQSMRHLKSHPSREVLILSGDQLYQMDFRTLADTHRNNRAQVTVGVIPVAREQTAGFGILKVDSRGRIIHFEEKPGPERLDALESDIPGYGRGFLASMGIYLFERDYLEKSISDPALVDFGRHVIPRAIGITQVQAHVFRGYWEDVGTIGSYFDAGLQLTKPLPPFDFHDANRPVYSRPRFLPATRIEGCTLHAALVSEGCILLGAEVRRSVIGIRSRIGQGTRIEDTLMLGADFYESLEEIDRANARGVPPIGIGAECVIRHAIIDKNARIGRGVRIQNEAGVREADGAGYYVR
ncbi:MAG TPA: glucose-1-phosphate adenylyltransferase, partial [Anaeromyxobacter sp.]|nr:glucose-1-phosphate adenylyltransferase [Anaeromyxobacter sp.]